MSTPTKLFLEWNDHDGQYQVHDKDGFVFDGGSFEPKEAIAHARTVSDVPIHIGEFQDIEQVCVSEKPIGAIEDTETFISALAEIGGMKVIKCFNDEMNFIGYTMEVKE